MVPPPLTTYLAALALTLAVELPLLLLILRGRVSWPRILLAGLLGSGITHPQLWYLWPRVFVTEGGFHYTSYIVCGELAVVAIEAVVIGLVCRRGVGVLMALGASALANAGSYAVGVMLNALVEW